MKKKYIITIFLILCFLSCGKSKPQKAKELMAIGDYPQAINILKQELKKKPKDVQSRKILSNCFIEKEEWEKAIEQREIIKKINNSPKNDFILMKLYALDGQFNEVFSLSKKYTPIYSYIFDTFVNRSKFKKRLSLLKDSLRDEGDTLTTQINKHPKILEINKKFNSRMENVIDSLGVKNYFLAKGLYELNNKNKYRFEDFFKLAIKSDSSLVKYIRPKIKNYIDNMKKPEPKLGKTEYYYNDIQNYYNKKGDLYKLVGLNEEALSEYKSAIWWFEQNPQKINRDSWINIQYYQYIELLLELGKNFETIEYINDVKLKYDEQKRYIWKRWETTAKRKIYENKTAKNLLKDAKEYNKNYQTDKAIICLEIIKENSKDKEEIKLADSLMIIYQKENN